MEKKKKIHLSMAVANAIHGNIYFDPITIMQNAYAHKIMKRMLKKKD